MAQLYEANSQKSTKKLSKDEICEIKIKQVIVGS